MDVGINTQEAAGQLADMFDEDMGLEVEEVEDEVVEEVVEELEEEAEGESGEENPEEEPEEGAEGEPEEEGEGEGDLVEIEIDGETWEVNQEELKAGYLRNEHLLRKSQELEAKYAERENEVLEKASILDQELESVQLMQGADLYKYKQINWEALKREDPERWKELRLEAIDAEEKLKLTNSKRKQLQELHAKAQEIKQEAYLKQQRQKALDLMPEFAEESFRSELVRYGKEVGFDEEEIHSITDARTLFLLNQARLFASSQARKKDALEKKVVKDVPKVIKPGTQKAAGQESAKAVNSAKARLKSSGSLKDAADLFLQMNLV